MSLFIEQWKEHQTQAVKTMYPELEDEKIDKLLDDMISEQMVNPKATLHNNYEHKALNIDLLSVIDWIDRVKPIIAGFGCFFKNQDTEINPTATMLNKFIKSRKAYEEWLYVKAVYPKLKAIHSGVYDNLSDKFKEIKDSAWGVIKMGIDEIREKYFKKGNYIIFY